MKYFLPKYLYGDTGFVEEKFIEVNDNGVITQIGAIRDLTNQQLENATKLDGYVIPGLVNSHSHAFQVLLRGKADHPSDFKDWVSSHLYPLVRKLKTSDISTASKVAFAQMIRNGITTIGEFHYLHNLHPDEPPIDHTSDPITEEVINSAKNVGIRMRLLYTGYDLGSRPGQERFHRNVPQVIESLNTLWDKYKEDPLIHIGAAPHSLHGASEEMIISMVEWAIKRNEIAHIHIAEQKSDIQESKMNYGCLPVEYLDRLGVLSENLAIVHGIWVDSNEINLLANKGVKHVYNPLTNMYLGDGIAPILEYIGREIPVAVGTDANVTLDLLREIRTVEWLQRVSSLEMGRIKSIKGSSVGEELFKMGTSNGGSALKLKVGKLEPGYYADFLHLNLNDLSIKNPMGGSFLEQLVSSISIPHVLNEVYVGGNLVYSKAKGFRNFDEMSLVDKYNALSF